MIVSLADWNSFLSQHPNAHLLQTGEWGELKSAFGWKPVRVISESGSVQILFRKLPLGFSIGYIPKANVDVSIWDEIDSACKQNRAIFLKLEPDQWEDERPIPNYQLPISPHNIQPPRTLLVDIRGSDEEILARMKQKTRYNIRLAEKKGVTVRAWEHIASFDKMMLITGGRAGFGSRAGGRDGGRPITAVVGGFHLLAASQERMEETLAALKQWRIQRLAAGHCTGTAAIVRLWTAFPGRCCSCAVGTKMMFQMPGHHKSTEHQARESR